MDLLMSTMKHKFAPGCNEVKLSSVFSVVIKIDNQKKNNNLCSRCYKNKEIIIKKTKIKNRKI